MTRVAAASHTRAGPLARRVKPHPQRVNVAESVHRSTSQPSSTSVATPSTISSMASSAHPTFPTRPYASNLGKLPDRALGGTFGASTTQQQRENARLERERDKLEKERMEREEQNQLTEEQREEIKEAVRSQNPSRKATNRTIHKRQAPMFEANSCVPNSSCSSTSTKTRKSTTTNSKSP